MDCKQAIQILSNEEIKREIIRGYFFSSHGSMLEPFDLVISFGVLEQNELS